MYPQNTRAGIREGLESDDIFCCDANTGAVYMLRSDGMLRDMEEGGGGSLVGRGGGDRTGEGAGAERSRCDVRVLTSLVHYLLPLFVMYIVYVAHTTFCIIHCPLHQQHAASKFTRYRVFRTKQIAQST